MSAMQEIDQGKLDQFMGRFVGDLGAALSAALVVIGDRLGLYRAMGDGAPVTPDELARRTGTDPRYVREWLSNQAAGGYVSYDPGGEAFSLTPEQALALAQEGSPAFVPGAFQLATALVKDEPAITEAFRSGAGVGWHEHDQDLFAGTERFFRPGYSANLVSSWIPSLDGVRAKLESGARVADVGCGHGASTLIMALAFPRSQFVGFDYHQASIEHARQAASAPRPRATRRSGSRSAPRPAKHGCAKSSPRVASRVSAAPPRPRSTSSSKLDRSPADWGGADKPLAADALAHNDVAGATETIVRTDLADCSALRPIRQPPARALVWRA